MTLKTKRRLTPLAVFWLSSVLQQLSLAMTRRYGFVTLHSNEEQGFEVRDASTRPHHYQILL